MFVLHWQAGGCSSWLQTQELFLLRTRAEMGVSQTLCSIVQKLHLSSSAPQVIPNKANLLSARQASNTLRQLFYSMGLVRVEKYHHFSYFSCGMVLSELIAVAEFPKMLVATPHYYFYHR